MKKVVTPRTTVNMCVCTSMNEILTASTWLDLLYHLYHAPKCKEHSKTDRHLFLLQQQVEERCTSRSRSRGPPSAKTIHRVTAARDLVWVIPCVRFCTVTSSELYHACCHSLKIDAVHPEGPKEHAHDGNDRRLISMLRWTCGVEQQLENAVPHSFDLWNFARRVHQDLFLALHHV